MRILLHTTCSITKLENRSHDPLMRGLVHECILEGGFISLACSFSVELSETPSIWCLCAVVPSLSTIALTSHSFFDHAWMATICAAAGAQAIFSVHYTKGTKTPGRHQAEGVRRRPRRVLLHHHAPRWPLVHHPQQRGHCHRRARVRYPCTRYASPAPVNCIMLSTGSPHKMLLVLTRLQDDNGQHISRAVRCRNLLSKVSFALR